eukprot:scaffold244656_cov22-Tisochrysis_lutea.AAC.1
MDLDGLPIGCTTCLDASRLAFTGFELTICSCLEYASSFEDPLSNSLPLGRIDPPPSHAGQMEAQIPAVDQPGQNPTEQTKRGRKAWLHVRTWVLKLVACLIEREPLNVSICCLCTQFFDLGRAKDQAINNLIMTWFKKHFMTSGTAKHLCIRQEAFYDR